MQLFTAGVDASVYEKEPNEEPDHNACFHT